MQMEGHSRSCSSRTAGAIVLLLAAVACSAEPKSAAGAAIDGSVGVYASGEPPFVPCEELSGTTALCVSFSPETVTPEAEPELDQSGVLTLQIFDTPNAPPGELGSRLALFELTLPSDHESGAEMGLADLPEPMAVLPGEPSTVYVRALFFDSSKDGAIAGFDWGTWYGGLEFPGGLGPNAPLTAVPLTAGATNRLEVVLHPLRRLSVNVTASVAPVGDGEGAISLMASRAPGLPPEVPTYGYGIDPCVDLARASQRIDMLMIGTGSFFIAASFDDLGLETPGEMPPGTLLSVDDYDLATNTGTFDEITLEPDQYSAEIALDLGFVVPLPDGVGPPGPNSCRDLGLPY